MTKRIISLVALFQLLIASQAEAAFSPLAVSLFSPAEFPPGDFAITGVRANILWGRHRSVYGFDFGVANTTDQNFVGVSVAGLFNANYSDATVLGLQLGGLANINTGKLHLYGLQISAGVNYNAGESGGVGFQVAPFANLSPHLTLVGAQVGLYNTAHEVYGFQIGLYNAVDTLHGIQIGLINVNRTGLFSIAPLVNVGF